MRLRIDRPLKNLQVQWNKQPALAWALSGLWVALVVWVAVWLHLGSIGLVDETEPLFAEAARQMTLTGDWVTPYFNGATRFDKPPLVYWIMALAYQTIGVNEWAVRFPSALAATVLAGFGLYVLRRFGYPRPGDVKTAQPALAQRADRALWLSAWIGSALIVLNPQTLAWGRIGVSDMLLSGCMGSALMAFFCGYAQPDRPKTQTGWYIAFHVFSALAVLTKGPVGIVLPALIIVGFLLYVGQLRPVLREMRLLWGGLLFLVITVPWYVLVIRANGEAYINAFFGYHNFDRFVEVVNGHWAPWYFYFIVVPLAFAPWSIHLPVAIARLRFWQMQRWRQQSRSSHLGLFALAWLLGVFGFFTIAVTKLPSYVIPLLPAAAILTALFWSDQMTRQSQQRGVKISHGVNIALLIALAIASLYSPHWIGSDPELRQMPQLVQQAGLQIWAAVIFGAAAIAQLVMLLRQHGRWLWSANLIAVLAFVLLVLLPASNFMDLQRQLPLRQMAATIVQQEQVNEPVVMVGFGKPTLVFYSHRPVVYVHDPEDLPMRLAELAKQRPGARSVLIVGRPGRFARAGLKPEQYQVIQEVGIYQLIRTALLPGG